MKTVLAVLLSVGAAIGMNYAVYLQKIAVGKLPEVNFKDLPATLKAFFKNRLWLLSLAVTGAGGVLYFVAVSIAPISIVQPIVASGVALLAYLAIKNLGEKPRNIDIVAIGLSILGVILIGVSLVGGLEEEVRHDPGLLWLSCGIVVALAVVIPLLMSRGGRSSTAAGLGISVGLLFGMGAVFARPLMVDFNNRGPVAIVTSAFILAWMLLMVPAFVVYQAALQRGMAIIVVPIVAGLSGLVPILGGTIALNEPFPVNDILKAVRVVAFALVLISAIILSKRAEEAGPGTAVQEEGKPQGPGKAVRPSVVRAGSAGFPVGGTAEAEPLPGGVEEG